MSVDSFCHGRAAIVVNFRHFAGEPKNPKNGVCCTFDFLSKPRNVVCFFNFIKVISFSIFFMKKCRNYALSDLLKISFILFL